MAEAVAPTRSNLLQRRDQLRLAQRGADLAHETAQDAVVVQAGNVRQQCLDRVDQGVNAGEVGRVEQICGKTRPAE